MKILSILKIMSLLFHGVYIDTCIIQEYTFLHLHVKLLLLKIRILRSVSVVFIPSEIC